MNVPELALRHQQLDARAVQMRAQIQHLEARLAENPEVEGLNGEVAAKDAARRDLEIRVRQRERDAETRRTRLKARERELMSGRIRNPSELVQLSREADQLRAALAKEEDAELQLMEEQERVEAELRRLQQQLEDARRRGEEAAPGQREAIVRLHSGLAETDAELEETWRQLPADWQAAYRRVAARVANPVAEVIRGQCQACHVAVTSNGMQVLRRAGLLLCDNCGRLLVVA